MGLFPDRFVQSAQLGANGTKRATTHLPSLLILFQLVLNYAVAVVFHALERRNLRGENLVHYRTFFIPMILEGRHSQV